MFVLSVSNSYEGLTSKSYMYVCRERGAGTGRGGGGEREGGRGRRGGREGGRDKTIGAGVRGQYYSHAVCVCVCVARARA